MYDKLYPDFKLTPDNCDKEPIHRPLAIQGHGHILIFDQKNLSHLYAMSDSIPHLFALKESDIWSETVIKWLPKSLHFIYSKINTPNGWNTADSTSIELLNQQFNVIIHIHAGKFIIELEHHLESQSIFPSSPYGVLRNTSECLSVIDSKKALYEETAKQFKSLTGYDRVMVYKFDEEYHGHVVGEAKEQHLSSYLDLHYPATDIPKMARDLFLKNKSRIIQDIKKEVHWLKFNPDVNPASERLDLSFAQLRATSPIHIEYLNNIGVRATLTLAIVVDNKLWGLIACHNYSPYYISYTARKTCEIVVDVFVKRLLEIQKQVKKEKAAELTELTNALHEKLNINFDISFQIIDRLKDVQGLCNADGIALVSDFAGEHVRGLTPEKSKLARIVFWLEGNLKGDIYYSERFSEELPQDLDINRKIGGIMACKINEGHPFYILWFRYSKPETTTWGHKPEKSFSQTTNEKTGEVILSPQNSFELWKTQTYNVSKKWEQYEIDTIETLKRNIHIKELHRKAKKALQLEEDIRRITYIASHDLQEPLKTVTNFLLLIREELEDDIPEDLKYFSGRTEKAAERMKFMLNDMLSFSRTGNDDNYALVDLNEVITEVIEDLHDAFDRTQAKIEVDKLPTIRAVFIEMKQLFMNLISNAIKYQKPGIIPEIRVSARLENHEWIICVKDNGIGIETGYTDKIFGLFQRLHSKHEYDGTGIGLAICKKIVGRFEGDIWVESEPGVGSEFFVKIHQTFFKK